MFGGIRRAWREARSTELRKDVESTLVTMNRFSQEHQFVVAKNMVDALAIFEKHYGDLENVSQKMHHQMSKQAYAQARSVYDRNVAGSCGVFLAGAYVESRSLPGDDAVFVRDLMDDLAASAVSAVRDWEQDAKATFEAQANEVFEEIYNLSRPS